MDLLPTEVVERILSYVDLETACGLENVCNRWYYIISRNHYQPYLIRQEHCIVQNLIKEGWKTTSTDPDLISRLFRKVMFSLPDLWRIGKPQIQEKLVSEFFPGEMGCRVSDLAMYKKHLYLGFDTCEVKVYSLDTLESLYSLETQEEEEDVMEHLARGCQLVSHGRTLAVTSSARDKVKLYNMDTDEMVGEIETRLGPIYNIAMTDRLLVCLSGWSCLSWRIDSSRPDTVRGQFRGLFPDFLPTDEFQNWLEIHAAVININWLVTRATRVQTQPGARTISFLHCRKLGPDGHIGPVLRPEQAAMPETVVEVNTMALNSTSLLATLVMMKPTQSTNPPANNPLHHVIEVTDISTGDLLASLPSQSILSSVKMPVCWRNEILFVKNVPNPNITELIYKDEGEEESNDFEVSLAQWNVRSGEVEEILHAKVDSASDLINVESSRMVIVSTKFNPCSNLPGVEYNTDMETLAALELNLDQAFSPKMSTKVEVHDYWHASLVSV